jgi:hypothetical protein
MYQSVLGYNLHSAHSPRSLRTLVGTQGRESSLLKSGNRERAKVWRAAWQSPRV